MSKKTVKFAQKTGAEYDAFAAMLEGEGRKMDVGQIVKGTISEVRGNEVLVDIGYKAPGVLNVSEFKDVELKVGDQYDVLVCNLETRDGMVELSKSQADAKLRWEALLQKYTEGCTLTGKITGRVRGGFTIVVDGIDAFLPGSHLDIDPVHEPDSYIGQELEFKLMKISHERRNLILSRRELLEERQADQKRELLSTIEKGQRRTGRVKNRRKVSLKIPRGVDTGSRIRLSGKGESGSRGGEPGDLYVVIHVRDHEIFERDGANLICEIHVPPHIAALGGSVPIPTPEGEGQLKIPSGTTNGKVFRLRGKGMTTLHGEVGDLLVHVDIEVPQHLSSKQKKALEAFAEVSDADNFPEAAHMAKDVKKFMERRDALLKA